MSPNDTSRAGDQANVWNRPQPPAPSTRSLPAISALDRTAGPSSPELLPEVNVQILSLCYFGQTEATLRAATGLHRRRPTNQRRQSAEAPPTDHSQRRQRSGVRATLAPPSGRTEKLDGGGGSKEEHEASSREKEVERTGDVRLEDEKEGRLCRRCSLVSWEDDAVSKETVNTERFRGVEERLRVEERVKEEERHTKFRIGEGKSQAQEGRVKEREEQLQRRGENEEKISTKVRTKEKRLSARERVTENRRGRVSGERKTRQRSDGRAAEAGESRHPRFLSLPPLTTGDVTGRPVPPLRELCVTFLIRNVSND